MTEQLEGAGERVGAGSGIAPERWLGSERIYSDSEQAVTKLPPLNNCRKGAKSGKQTQGNFSVFSPGSAVTQRGKIIALSVHLHFLDLSCNPLLTVSVKIFPLKECTDKPI